MYTSDNVRIVGENRRCHRGYAGEADRSYRVSGSCDRRPWFNANGTSVFPATRRDL